MGRLMEICDKVIAELETSGKLSVTQDQVNRIEPTPSPNPSRPISQPVEVEPDFQLPPSPLSDTEVRQAIDALIRHCQTWGDLPIGQYIRLHPERWRTRGGLPGIADEYAGMVEMMTELHADQGSRIPTEAARAVCSWIEYRDLERISNQEYRNHLQACWDALRNKRIIRNKGE